jgi:hypothetical protein
VTVNATGDTSAPRVSSIRRLPLTARPDTFAEKFVNSAVVWLVLMAAWALTDTLMTIFPTGGRPVQPDGWLTHVIFTVAGLAGIWCSHRTGFPAAWDERLSPKYRFLVPALIGIGFGILASAFDTLTGASKILEAALGQPFNVAFPGSLLVYSSGAVTMELIFRLFLVPVLLWVISGLILKGRRQSQVFWALAALSSLLEPGVLQGVPLLILSKGAITLPVFAGYFVQSYALNFTQAVFFRKYGFLASIVVRFAYYAIWHVIYGNFIYPSV